MDGIDRTQGEIIMIAQRNTSYNPIEINEEGTIHTILALLSQRPRVSLSRWDCDVCGMIHMGQPPLTCDSCGSELLTQQPDIHVEMNNHW
jgi:rubrerythrin